MKREETGNSYVAKLLKGFYTFIRKCIFKVISVGSIPDHIAFILDGNRRYAKKWKLTEEGAGHRAGFVALTSMLKYCRELGIKYVTIYAFSIDNFKRTPEEIQFLMDLMLEKMELLLKEDLIKDPFGVRVIFIGDLRLLCEPLRLAAEKTMLATAKNTKIVILVCVAYTSTNEMVNAVQESGKDRMTYKTKVSKDREGCTVETEAEELIKLVDVERHMYTSVAPDPDILIRTSGEHRLSNFLTWQTRNCLLYFPTVLWPEIGLRHLLWAILNFQRMKKHQYLQSKKQV